MQIVPTKINFGTRFDIWQLEGHDPNEWVNIKDYPNIILMKGNQDAFHLLD